MQKETVVTIAKPSSNIISLKELADDTCLWKKSQKDYTKTLKKCKIKKIKKNKILAEEKVTQFQFLLIYESTLKNLYCNHIYHNILYNYRNNIHTYIISRKS